MEYSTEVERRLRSPSRPGFSPDGGGAFEVGSAEDRSLNVWVRYQVQVVDGTIRSIRFEAYGCPHFLAAADWLAERLEGEPKAALGQPVAQAAQNALEVPTEKLGKLLVLEDALAACARFADER